MQLIDLSDFIQVELQPQRYENKTKKRKKEEESATFDQKASHV